MNILTQIGKQLSDLFSSMTPQARVMAGLMVGVIVVSLGWILASQTVNDTEMLLGASFTHAELDQMEAAFSEAQLRGHKRVGRQMQIPTAEKDQYMRALSANNALPEKWGDAMQNALNAGNPFESPLKQATRFQSAKEQSVATILKMSPDIEFAAVQYDEKKTAFMRETEQVCSVYLRAPQGRSIDSSLKRSVSGTILTSFAGLSESQITVFDLNTGETYRGNLDPDGGEESAYLQQQIRIEEKIKSDVRELLKNDYGNIRLLASATLSDTISKEEEQLVYDSVPVALQSVSTSKNSTNQKSAPAGRVGANPNGVASANNSASLSNSSPEQTSTLKESLENQKRVAGHTASHTRTAGLIPTEVRVTVGIPESHYRRVWTHRQLAQAGPEAKPEEYLTVPPAELASLKQEIETNVTNALASIPVGIRGGEDAKPLITVVSYDDLPVEPLPMPSTAQTAFAWLYDSWSTLALLAVLLISLGMMFSWVKSQGDAKSNEEFAQGFGLQIPENIYDELETDSTGGLDGEDGEVSGSRKVAFEVTGTEMKEDLSTLIKENPDVAVNLLKTWIGDAA